MMPESVVILSKLPLFAMFRCKVFSLDAGYEKVLDGIYTALALHFLL